MSEPAARTVAVIGAGPGGYAAAFHAADLGLNVTLIDPAENPGGVCLYRGCIPSKALLHVAKLLHEAKAAKDWGISFSAPKIDVDKLRAWKQGVVDKLTKGLGQLTQARQINYLRGRASFLDRNTLKVIGADGRRETVSFDSAILATGSEPAVIPSLMIDSPRVIDSTGALELEDVPKKLLVVGGGYIGLELSTVYAALGSKVHVVEMLPGLLPGADRDLVKVLARRLENDFDKIMLETKVTSLEETDKGIKAKFDGKNAPAKAVTYDKVLFAIGRRPTTAGLGLENTLVGVDDHGFVEVDAQRRTAESSIFCIGDLAGQPLLAHKAAHEGLVAADVIAGQKAAFEPYAIPGVVFTDPEVAWCGLTETQAKDRGRDVKTAVFPWAASGRATAVARNDGLTKLIIDPETDRILGVGMVGVGVGEMIAEGVLAIEMGATATDLALTIHPHPTLSETIMEAAELAHGATTHIFKPPRRRKK